MTPGVKYYYYRILLPDGRLKSGLLPFQVERDFSVQLHLERQYKALVLRLYRFPSWMNALLAFLREAFARGLGTRELAGLLRDLGVMLGAGVPLIDALRTLSGEAHFAAGGGGVQRAVDALINDLSSGDLVSQAFDRHPDLFPEVVRNLVLIGDESGRLPQLFLEAAEYLDRLAEIGGNARRSLIYPACVFVTMFAAAGFWLYYVIPNLSELFRQMNAKMPAMTLAVMDAANWLAEHVALSLWLLAVLILAPFLCARYSERARHAFFRLLHRLPISGVLLRTSGMAFLTEHLAILVRSGIDMTQSLKILERATRDEYYRKGIARVAQTMSRGEHLSVAMRAAGCFPPLSLRLVAVGEETGTLDEQLARLAGEYRRRFSHLVDTLGEVLRPAVILFAGAFFIFLIVVLLLPVYDLIRQSMLISAR